MATSAKPSGMTSATVNFSCCLRIVLIMVAGSSPSLGGGGWGDPGHRPSEGLQALRTQDLSPPPTPLRYSSEQRNDTPGIPPWNDEGPGDHPRGLLLVLGPLRRAEERLRSLPRSAGPPSRLGCSDGPVQPREQGGEERQSAAIRGRPLRGSRSPPLTTGPPVGCRTPHGPPDATPRRSDSSAGRAGTRCAATH